MSGLHHVSRHSPPHVRKSAATRAARSAPAITHKLYQKGNKARKQSKEIDDEEDDVFTSDSDDDNNMASTFLQYCAMCEKQILVPNSSFLYCSEHCRKQDAMPSPASFHPFLSLSTPKKLTDLPATFLDPYGHYAPTLKPTPRHPEHPRIPPQTHNGHQDLDPTEWKPSEPNRANDDDHGQPKVKASRNSKNAGSRPKLPTKEPSEALLYLSKYHPTSPPSSSVSKHRPATGRTTPSLSHASTASSPCSNESSLPGTPYSFVSPPAPRLSGISVTTAPSTAQANAALMETLSLGAAEKRRAAGYEKRDVKAADGSATGSLKKLLAGGGR